MEKTSKSVKLEIKRDKRIVTISNNVGDSWQLPKYIDEQTALCILVAKTLWSRFDNQSLYMNNFKITLEIEPLEEK